MTSSLLRDIFFKCVKVAVNYSDWHGFRKRSTTVLVLCMSSLLFSDFVGNGGVPVCIFCMSAGLEDQWVYMVYEKLLTIAVILLLPHSLFLAFKCTVTPPLSSSL